MSYKEELERVQEMLGKEESVTLKIDWQIVAEKLHQRLLDQEDIKPRSKDEFTQELIKVMKAVRQSMGFMTQIIWEKTDHYNKFYGDRCIDQANLNDLETMIRALKWSQR